MNANDFVALLSTARVGDTLVIAFEGGSRTVVVTEVSDGRIFTTTGHARPGRLDFGLLRCFDGAVQFHPTMRQPARDVTELRRSALLRVAA